MRKRDKEFPTRIPRILPSSANRDFANKDHRISVSILCQPKRTYQNRATRSSLVARAYPFSLLNRRKESPQTRTFPPPPKPESSRKAPNLYTLLLILQSSWSKHALATMVPTRPSAPNTAKQSPSKPAQKCPEPKPPRPSLSRTPVPR